MTENKTLPDEPGIRGWFALRSTVHPIDLRTVGADHCWMGLVVPATNRFGRTSKESQMSMPQSAVDLAKCTVHVPVARLIEKDCELALRGLEALGVSVQRPYGANVDIVRNVCASQEIIKGSDSMMFIDSDIWFEPEDAIKLLNRPEPVVSGVYAKKARVSMERWPSTSSPISSRSSWGRGPTGPILSGVSAPVSCVSRSIFSSG